MPEGTYEFTLYNIEGSGNGSFTVLNSFTVSIYDDDDNLGIGDDSPGTETGNAPVILSLSPGAPANWAVGDTFYFGGSRGIEEGSSTDDFLVPKVAGVWQTNTVLYSMPGASIPLEVGESYTQQGASGNVDEEVVPCFVSGSLIKTLSGEIPIQNLRPGDKVLTLDNGYQSVLWIGTKSITASEATAPIRFVEGVVGNKIPLLVSPNHRMLVKNPNAVLLFGDSEVLVPAKFFLGLEGVSRVELQDVVYIHILFETHQIVNVNGAWSESFHPGDQALGSLDEDTRNEVVSLFPEILQRSSNFSKTARVCLKRFEASLLAA